MRRRLRQLALLLAALVLTFHVTTARAVDPYPGHVVLRSYYASAIRGTEHMAVYLPTGYDGRRRYPVIYALHGLPSDDTGYRRLDVPAFGHAAEQAGHPAIVVAPQGAPQRGLVSTSATETRAPSGRTAGCTAGCGPPTFRTASPSIPAGTSA